MFLTCFLDEKALRANAKGLTALEEESLGEKIVKAIAPFWGPIEDLLSGDPARIELAKIGILGDLMILMPLGKFLGASARLISTGAQLSFKATLPKFVPLTVQLFYSVAIEAIPNPVDPVRGLLLLLRLGTIKRLRVGASLALIANGLDTFRASRKTLTYWKGSFSVIDNLPVVSPGTWKPLYPSDQLRVVNDLDGVAVRNISSALTPDYYLIDPVSKQPYGSALVKTDDTQVLPFLKIEKALPEESLIKAGPYAHCYERDGKYFINMGNEVYQVEHSLAANKFKIVDPSAPDIGVGPYYVSYEGGEFLLKARLRLKGGGPLMSLLKPPETLEQQQYNTLLESIFVPLRNPSVRLVATTSTILKNLPEKLVNRIVTESMRELGVANIVVYRQKIRELNRWRVGLEQHAPLHKNLMHKFDIWNFVQSTTQEMQHYITHTNVIAALNLSADQKIKLCDVVSTMRRRDIVVDDVFSIVHKLFVDAFTGVVFLGMVPSRGRASVILNEIRNVRKNTDEHPG